MTNPFRCYVRQERRRRVRQRWPTLSDFTADWAHAEEWGPYVRRGDWFVLRRGDA